MDYVEKVLEKLANGHCKLIETLLGPEALNRKPEPISILLMIEVSPSVVCLQRASRFISLVLHGPRTC